MPGGSGVVLPFRPPLASGAPSAPGVIAAAAPIIIMSDKSDLKAELERKKQRLAQIREEKKRKEEERKKKEVDFQQKKEPTQEDSDLDRKRRETEALLQSIGISPEPPLVPTPMSPSPKSVSTPSEAGSQDSGDLGPVGRTLQWDTDPSVLQLQSDSELGRRLHKLGVSKITQVDFLPREVVSYSKETQTPLDAHRSEEDEEDEELVEPKAQNDSEIETQEKKQDVKEAPPRELTEEEKQQILHSEEFLIFFDRTIRVIERALAEDSDIFFDYSGRDVEDKDGDIQAGANLSFNRQFYDEHWSKHRVVTCMDWSLQYPELMVASYNNNEDAPHEPDGVALVWNMKFKKTTPEYVFHCQSSVMSVCFARFHPNLVVGGTYSGQIVLWDNRSHRRTPVQRTPLSAAAHTHPVYCVNVVGTQNAHNLITVSTDGKMCSWSLDMLSTPQESMELVYNKSKPVAVTGMAFPTGDVNNFVVGSEEGTVYTACRHGSLNQLVCSGFRNANKWFVLQQAPWLCHLEGQDIILLHYITSLHFYFYFYFTFPCLQNSHRILNRKIREPGAFTCMSQWQSHQATLCCSGSNKDERARVVTLSRSTDLIET
ncbi:cytoplasmic dynein 1 intermediate chain 1 isoform X7 [Hemicordylus capensis]|uniref:cytoplasmic dynein 1 intermediate chain 1 isoform X7 n=1 Tax=Hemicordylus capensis TaxID=884348 RepID=UPI002303E349|nr:cytoplasmic dynein 1 intermediate chain 1 isoform X7 [Hemicordylus capensis]